MSLTSLLPAPRNVSTSTPVEPARPTVTKTPKKEIPVYGQRQGYLPRSPEDFGDGGAFPEIHVKQYPLLMGKKPQESSAIVPLSMDANGHIKYDAIVTQGTSKIVYARHEDLVEKHLDATQLKRPDADQEMETVQKTKAALEKVVSGKIKASHPTKPSAASSGSETFIKYTPSTAVSVSIEAGDSSSAADQSKSKVIRLVDLPVDPLEPARYKHKRAPRRPPSPPPPVMHSPPRKLTAKDQQDWKIPPCISSWKNTKGYTIPLDKRLAADGSRLQTVQLNDNFARVIEALYAAERSAREAVAKRAQIKEALLKKKRDEKEELLRKLAQEAREERMRATVAVVDPAASESRSEYDERVERERIRDERRRERERERRMEALGSKRAKTLRDQDRDVSEKIALGQAAPTRSTEAIFDQRLFNQTEGVAAGFDADDAYTVYDKPLFAGGTAGQLYKPNRTAEDAAAADGDRDYDSLLNTRRFKPDRGFQGADTAPAGGHQGPVEFEKEEDPFGLDDFLKEAKSGVKKLFDGPQRSLV